MSGQLTWAPYVWERPRAASEADLARAEAAFGIRFPEDYRSFIPAHQGETPSPGGFDFRQAGKASDSTVNVLLHFLPDAEEGADYDIVATNRDARDTLAPGLVVFAEDPAGNYLAFDFRRSATAPPIVFVDHERVGKPGWISPVAENFTAFLAALKE